MWDGSMSLVKAVLYPVPGVLSLPVVITEVKKFF